MDEVIKIMEGTLKSLGAAPFLKKALWVLRHLDDQDVSNATPVPERLRCLVSES